MERVQGSLGARRELGPGGEDFFVAVPRSTEKTYTCPACSREIPGTMQHVVAWPAEHILGQDAAAELRRHWHRACWESFGRSRG